VEALVRPLHHLLHCLEVALKGTSKNWYFAADLLL